MGRNNYIWAKNARRYTCGRRKRRDRCARRRVLFLYTARQRGARRSRLVGATHRLSPPVLKISFVESVEFADYATGWVTCRAHGQKIDR
jgi:hypothetical protein